VLTPFYDKVKALQPRTDIRRVIATNVKENLSQPLRLLFTLLKEKKEGHRVTLRPADRWLSSLLNHPLVQAGKVVFRSMKWQLSAKGAKRAKRAKGIKDRRYVFSPKQLSSTSGNVSLPVSLPGGGWVGWGLT